MAIGTSLGAYFESPFHHEAGIETPPDTGDDNVLPPDADTQANPPKEAKVIPIADVRGINKTPFKIQLPDAFGGPEAIRSPALKFGEDIFEAPNHGMALTNAIAKDPYRTFPDGKEWDAAQGFTTTRGRFISREEAFGMAKKQDQIKDEVLPALTTDSKVLLSEDLRE